MSGFTVLLIVYVTHTTHCNIHAPVKQAVNSGTTHSTTHALRPAVNKALKGLPDFREVVLPI